MAKNLVLIGGGEIKGWNFQTKDENQDLYQTEKECIKNGWFCS